jgi:hypothetical protein
MAAFAAPPANKELPAKKALPTKVLRSIKKDLNIIIK